MIVLVNIYSSSLASFAFASSRVFRKSLDVG